MDVGGRQGLGVGLLQIGPPSSAFFRTELLATLKLHYDGWLALPAGLRRTLDLKSGDRLVAELVDGTIVLRPANGQRAPAEPTQAVEPPAVASAAPPSLETAVPQQRPRGRPRKVQTLERPSELMLGTAGDPLPLPKRRLGRPRKVRVDEVEPAVEPGPSSRAAETGLWKLRPKAELPAASPEPESEPAPPPRRPEPSRYGGNHELEERRPFRNVEVRRLGPGRRHNRAQQTVEG
jgi:AbrB family looped-hinge helix DNA binding protein